MPPKNRPSITIEKPSDAQSAAFVATAKAMGERRLNENSICIDVEELLKGVGVLTQKSKVRHNQSDAFLATAQAVEERKAS
jgi:hypothetical protein